MHEAPFREGKRERGAPMRVRFEGASSCTFAFMGCSLASLGLRKALSGREWRPQGLLQHRSLLEEGMIERRRNDIWTVSCHLIVRSSCTAALREREQTAYDEVAIQAGVLTQVDLDVLDSGISQ